MCLKNRQSKFYLFLRVSCFCFGLIACLNAHAEETRKAKSQLVPCEQGMVFCNGEYIPAPYYIQSTTDSVYINAVKIPSSITVLMNGERNGERGNRERRNGPNREDRTRRNNRDLTPESETARLERSIRASLENEDVVVLFNHEHFRAISYPSDQYDLFQALLAGTAITSELSFLDEFNFEEESNEKWRSWIAGFSAPPLLEAEMKQFIKEIDDVEVQFRNKVNATARLEMLAYPLTLAGMILSVIAFGQLLQWIGKGFAENEKPKPESERYLVMALLLMLGMSLIDLLWTILANQAGVMREVNPVAVMYMDSPQQLAIFKVFATLLGFSILYIWRQRPVMQQATWWMCLVCVLVTFRWVVFNSMMT